MFLAVDVFYPDGNAKIVGFLFENWEDKEPLSSISFQESENNDYESGNFYKKELPCIVKLIERINLSEVKAIVVDGFVYLDDDMKFGLGGYLYKYLNQKIPVIGVAKNPFYNNSKNVIEIFRGESKKPLYISSIGIDNQKAAKNVKNMHGRFRIPTLLKKLDFETKKSF